MNPSHSKPKAYRWVAGSAAALVALGAGLWLFGGGGRVAAASADASPPAPAVPCTTALAQRRDVNITLSGIGTVTPVSTVTVTSRVAGVITQVDYVEGQNVKRGDLLVVIDPRPYQAAVDQADGQLARDQAMLRNARIDLDRYHVAYAKHAIPEQEVATQEATVQADEGIVRLDTGMLEAAKVNLDYTHIVSPIDGRVGLRLVDAGNIVQANGTTPLVTITQLQPITVVFTLSQDTLAQVQRGIRSGGPLPVEAFDRVQPKPIAVGKLLTIDNQVDPNTGTFRLKAVFDNPDDALWPGSFVDAHLVTSVDRGAVTVPARAVQNGPEGSYLFVVRPDRTAEMRSVEVGQVQDGVAEIVKGVAAGDTVVVDGQYRLENGSRVALQ